MEKSKVYFTKTITPEKVVEMYKILGKELKGKIAVKVHSGEKGNQNYLHPEFMKPMIDFVNGTVVECNTAYEGMRDTTEKHEKLMEEHGWSKYFNVDIMDKEGEIELSIPNGKIVLDFTLEALRVPVSSDSQEFTTLARNIHLFIQGPEHICITGKNGCGKTTLMRILAKELLQRSDIKAAYMPQNYEELLDMEQTPIAFLSDGSKESISMMRTYLGSMKFTTDEMEHPMRELSGGQKAKVMLLYLDTLGCDVLLLDEPSRNFSPLSNPVIRQMLANFQGAIISISHDRKYIAEVCDKVYQLTEEGLIL